MPDSPYGSARRAVKVELHLQRCDASQNGQEIIAGHIQPVHGVQEATLRHRQRERAVGEQRGGTREAEASPVSLQREKEWVSRGRSQRFNDRTVTREEAMQPHLQKHIAVDVVRVAIDQ